MKLKQETIDKRCFIRYNKRTQQWSVQQGIHVLWMGDKSSCKRFAVNNGLEIQNKMEIDTIVNLDSLDGVV